MAVSEYYENGEQLWSVYVNIRHKNSPQVRCQKRTNGFKTQQAALQEEKRLIRALTEEVTNLAERGLKWSELIDEWEIATRADKNRPISETTFIDNLSLLRRWTTSLSAQYAKEIGRGEIRQILRAAQDEGKSRSFQVNLKAAISGVYRWAIEENRIKGITIIPTEGIQLMKRSEEKPPEILTIEEIRRLLAEAKNVEHPWYPVWAMAVLTGMRAGELHALLWTDVDMEKDMLTVSKSHSPRLKAVKSTKAGYWRNVPISSELKKLLTHVKAKDPGRTHVLPRFKAWDKGLQAKILRGFCVGIGIRPVKFHTLRACFATQLLSNGISSPRIMKICGWQDLATMERYIRLAGIDEKGATECLRVLQSDSDVMAEVVNLLDFKAEKR